MTEQALKLRPGVDQNETPTLNEFGISTCNLIRFDWDAGGYCLVQKLGGWDKFYPQQISVPIRALAAWQDLDIAQHLAYGTQNSSGSSTLGVITNGNNAIVTPQSISDSVTPAASTTSGSPVVTITDATTTGITNYDAVYILTHIAIDGLVLFGVYPTILVDSAHYQIVATDAYGNPLPATSTTTTTTVASFTTTNNSNAVSVTLANHGYIAGDTYPILIPTTVGGLTLYGNYIVQSVQSSSAFTIYAQQQATSGATASINGGNAAYIYSFGIGANPPGGGYGSGTYGSGGYGVGSAITPSLGNPIPADDWTLDNFGQLLIACPVNGTLLQPIYQYDPTSGSPIATIIPQAPPLNDGFFIAMPQRQIVAWGSTETGIQDPLLVRWCDVSNPSQWIAQPSNQAGSYRLTTGSRIVAGLQAPQQGLLWTDVGLWSMTYIGGQLVYGFNEIAKGCGLISRKAAGVLGESVYWMSQSQFFVNNGEGVSNLPCTVWDVVFQNLDQNNLSKIRCAPNSRFNEIAWYFPVKGGTGEVSMYVKYNALVGAWDYGFLARSAWIDQSVLGPPIGADPGALYIYQHETSPDADSQPLLATFTTGYAAISEGDWKTFLDQMWPDMKWGYFGQAQNATVQITILGVGYPGETPEAFGPFSVTQATTFIEPRLRARLIALEVSSMDTGSFWRLGNIRYRAKPDGKFG